MTIDELKELSKKIYKTTNNLAETGRILRDRYLILNIYKEYGIRLKEIVQPTFPDVLYLKIKKFITFKKHIDENKKDLKNRIKYEQELKRINILIFNLKKQKVLDSLFVWTPSLAETIINKFSYNV